MDTTPIAILIFQDTHGDYSYRAFSSSLSDVDSFLASIYHHISYNPFTPLHNHTIFGSLLEVHSRQSDVPLSQRGNTCHFTTYSHPHCDYQPIHIPTPVFFSQTRSNLTSDATSDATSDMISDATGDATGDATSDANQFTHRNCPHLCL